MNAENSFNSILLSDADNHMRGGHVSSGPLLLVFFYVLYDGPEPYGD